MYIYYISTSGIVIELRRDVLYLLFGTKCLGQNKKFGGIEPKIENILTLLLRNRDVIVLKDKMCVKNLVTLSLLPCSANALDDTSSHLLY